MCMPYETCNLSGSVESSREDGVHNECKNSDAPRLVVAVLQHAMHQNSIATRSNEFHTCHRSIHLKVTNC